MLERHRAGLLSPEARAALEAETLARLLPLVLDAAAALPESQSVQSCMSCLAHLVDRAPAAVLAAALADRPGREGGGEVGEVDELGPHAARLCSLLQQTVPPPPPPPASPCRASPGPAQGAASSGGAGRQRVRAARAQGQPYARQHDSDISEGGAQAGPHRMRRCGGVAGSRMATDKAETRIFHHAQGWPQARLAAGELAGVAGSRMGGPGCRTRSPPGGVATVNVK